MDMNVKDTEQQVVRDFRIPSCPGILSSLQAELGSPMVNNKRLAALVGQDPAIAALLIRSANSAFYGGSSRITSLADAVSRLGTGMLTNLVMEAVLHQVVKADHQTLDRFWDSARYTAIAASRIAAHFGRVSPDLAYTMGLFHDIGIPMMLWRFPTYIEVLKKANVEPEQCFTDMEEAAFDTSHAVIGYFMTRAWGLDSTLSGAILRHHHYKLIEPSERPDEPMAHLIAYNVIAEHVADIHLRSRSGPELGKARESVSLLLGLEGVQLDDMIEDLILQFDAMLGDQTDKTSV